MKTVELVKISANDISYHPVTSNEWMDSASCATVDPELFYLAHSENDHSIRARQAIKVCQACPVIEECLAWAFEVHDEWGILGGTTATMRSGMEWKRSKSTGHSATPPGGARRSRKVSA